MGPRAHSSILHGMCHQLLDCVANLGYLTVLGRLQVAGSVMSLSPPPKIFLQASTDLADFIGIPLIKSQFTNRSLKMLSL